MDIYLTPVTATLLFIVAVTSGHMFRRNWKTESAHWHLKAWIYGCTSGLALLALGFIPLRF